MKTSAVSWRRRGRMALDYAVAVVAVGTAVIAGLVFHRISGFAPAASLFFCGIMFVAWFSGTGPGIFATARSDCGLAGGCGANQALANLCGVRGPWTGWQRCS